MFTELGELVRVGLLRRVRTGPKERLMFEYDRDWVANPASYALEPALPKASGVYPPSDNKDVYGSIGDSAPDSWGRGLLAHRENKAAIHEGRKERTLTETDYLMGASDLSRMGSLRFKWEGENEFQAPSATGVPKIAELARLQNEARVYLAKKSTYDIIENLVGAGSSLGGARPKASVVDSRGRLMIAKFPRETDKHSFEAWEDVAMRLAKDAGIEVPEHLLQEVDGKKVFLSYRFDRNGEKRIPFLSAMSMIESWHMKQSSYLDIVNAIRTHGVRSKADIEQLYRRMAFNVLISNVDDHMRNHAFLLHSPSGWVLSPAYDLNPTPTSLKPRFLSTNINFTNNFCSIELVLETADDFGLKLQRAKEIVRQVAESTRNWRKVANKVKRPKNEIGTMASAFEHEDLERAIRL